VNGLASITPELIAAIRCWLASTPGRSDGKLKRAGWTTRHTVARPAHWARLPSASLRPTRGCSSMAEHQLPKLNTGVRFPSSALEKVAASGAVLCRSERTLSDAPAAFVDDDEAAEVPEPNEPG
jgi:hypothetical protein